MEGFARAIYGLLAEGALVNPFEEFHDEERMRRAWDAVTMHRRVPYGLFTFGNSDLPYILLLTSGASAPISVARGEIQISRPLIITPDNARPEFQGFFEESDDDGMVEFLLRRTAMFSNLRLQNRAGSKSEATDDLDLLVSKITRRLDDDEEDRVAVLSAPKPLAGVALFRYATERIIDSSPGNVQELRERGFL